MLYIAVNKLHHQFCSCDLQPTTSCAIKALSTPH